MCGIAGFADSSTSNFRTPEADFSLVHTMCEVIRHRGPDDEGVHTEPGVGLGMRRLSIIDLSTGHQPIHNEDQTVWVVFNGEIYNYRELARSRDQTRENRTRPSGAERSSRADAPHAQGGNDAPSGEVDACATGTLRPIR